MNSNEGFHITYSAAQQQEVEDIRKKYLPQAESKLEQLRRLHRSAHEKAQFWALVLGVIGSLVLGTGMSLAMTDLGAVLGMNTSLCMLVGIPVGVAGMVLVALAYPVYNRLLRAHRRRIAPQILQLSDELLQ